MVAMSELQAAEQAYAFLRGHTRGDLRYEEDLGPVRYVIGPDGRLVSPVTYRMLEAVDTVLFVPAFAEGAMEVQVTVLALDPDGTEGAVADRWRIYHGEPQEARWAWLDPEAGRYGKWVIDGEALRRSNPLAADEARLCRQINQGSRDELRRVCRHFADADVEEPLVVGVDPLGFDVRRRFDVARVPAPSAMGTGDAVEQAFAQMVRTAGEAAGA
jgi:beta-glucosidase-like glycosyl hydrolase